MIWYSIWQSKEDDGDFVRANLGGGWKEHAPPIPGLAAVDGQRWLAINPDHSILTILSNL